MDSLVNDICRVFPIEHCGVPDLVKTEMGGIWERDVKSDEEKINKQWEKNIVGIISAHNKDNQQREKEFEEPRRSEQSNVISVTEGGDNVRRVEVGNERRLVVSIGMEQAEELSEVPLGPSSGNDLLAAPISVSTTAAGHTDPYESATSEESNSDTVILEDTTAQDTTDDIFDSSAALFNTHDGDPNSNPLSTENSVNFSTQTQINIQNIGGNYTQTPATQTRKIQSNYKFRKQSHLN